MSITKFKKSRLKLGLNEAQMAKVMNVHKSTMYKWENGEREPSAAAMQLVSTITFLKTDMPVAFNALLIKSGVKLNA